jgi:hypothetical protein
MLNYLRAVAALLWSLSLGGCMTDEASLDKSTMILQGAD